MIRSLVAFGRVARIGGFLAAWTLRMRLRRPATGSAAYEEWRRTYFCGAAEGILQRLGVHIESEGEFPPGGGLLVSNHLGYLDVLVLAALGPAVFVARADVEHWPVVGPMTRWCSTIYIDRDRREQIPEVLRAMQAGLETGASVVFFPEGTSGPGDTVMPFRASLFGVATVGGLPVRTAVISYHTEIGDPPARDSVCWWGDAGFVSHFFRLAGLKTVTARVIFPGATFTGTDRKELANHCRAAILDRFTPVTGSPSADG